MGRNEIEVSSAELWVHLAGGTADEYRRLRRTFGGHDRWRTLSASAWIRGGLSPRRARRLDALRDRRRVEQERAALRRFGVGVVAHRHRDYPARLRRLERPPLLLNVRGRWPPPACALAVVGSRAATPYGRQVASRLAAAATAAGAAVVSGLARGIDRFALEAALGRGGWPVAVLGCGIDVAYPAEHRALQDRIAREGTVVSEFPLGQRPTTFAFPRRNRVIAALARHVLVVEAGRRSGALITADYALELDVDVLVVPGPIDSPQSEGANRLLLDGAAPIVDTASLLAHLGDGLDANLDVEPGAGLNVEPGAGLAGVHAEGTGDTTTSRARTEVPGSPKGGSPPGAATAPAGERVVLDTLGTRALTVDEVAAGSGGGVRDVRAALVSLELQGSVERLPGDRYARRPTTGRRG